MTVNRQIVDALLRASDAGEPVVLATVARVTGSSYGGAGARMLIRADASTVGLVSGGCLESDLAEHARRVSDSNEAEVVTYDTRDDEDAPWGLGLGCNGLIEVLLEPLSAARAGEIARLIAHALSSDTPSILATVIGLDQHSHSAAKIGAHALFVADESSAGSNRAFHLAGQTGDWGLDSVLDAVAADAEEAVAAGRRGLVREYARTTVAFELVHPALHLVICGSGPDVAPIARSAVQLGWDVTVVDHRAVTPEHAARFPGAHVVECLDPSALEEVVSLSPRTAAVVMSHHFTLDASYLESLLVSSVAYVGALGPRARTEKMLSELAARPAGLASDDRLFAPVGMDVGGEGPDAIAISIIAEISAVIAGRAGGHLRDRRGALHAASSAPTR